ncbi:hypothetical protein MKW92_002930 [Papaver armeniacum]|nr:hypothetical protein MKW92_002930 [Papaver armeniacum]
MVPPKGLMHQPLGPTPEWTTSRFLPPARPSNSRKMGENECAYGCSSRWSIGAIYAAHSTSTPRPAISVRYPNNQQNKYIINLQMGKMQNLPNRVSSIAGPKSVRGGLKTLSTMLAEYQQQMLGEYLYPFVFQLQVKISDIVPSSEKLTDT